MVIDLTLSASSIDKAIERLELAKQTLSESCEQVVSETAFAAAVQSREVVHVCSGDLLESIRDEQDADNPCVAYLIADVEAHSPCPSRHRPRREYGEHYAFKEYSRGGGHSDFIDKPVALIKDMLPILVQEITL